MTTMITQSSSPRLPRPDAYRTYLDRVTAEHAEFVKRRKRERLVRRLTWACWIGCTVLIVGYGVWRVCK